MYSFEVRTLYFHFMLLYTSLGRKYRTFYATKFI